MIDELLLKIEISDSTGAEELARVELDPRNALNAHDSLFPVVQRVVNPPFINPHLPKMYRVCRELFPYLESEDVPGLVALEISEYARRPKLDLVTRVSGRVSRASISDVEDAVGQKDPAKVAALLDALQKEQGMREMARQVLLLGSGYMGQTLGHSVSCTAFILLELIDRTDQDSWPALAALADYFCKGQFRTTPDLLVPMPRFSEEDALLRATSGTGIVNLHHTITRYAIERTRPLLRPPEYDHMIAVWGDFMGQKEIQPPPVVLGIDSAREYAAFREQVAGGKEGEALAVLTGMGATVHERKMLGNFLVRVICDLYRGDYDPHFLTGLGSLLWIIDNYHGWPSVGANALRQYLNYFITQKVY